MANSGKTVAVIEEIRPEVNSTKMVMGRPLKEIGKISFLEKLPENSKTIQKE